VAQYFSALAADAPFLVKWKISAHNYWPNTEDVDVGDCQVEVTSFMEVYRGGTTVGWDGLHFIRLCPWLGRAPHKGLKKIRFLPELPIAPQS